MIYQVKVLSLYYASIKKFKFANPKKAIKKVQSIIRYVHIFLQQLNDSFLKDP